MANGKLKQGDSKKGGKMQEAASKSRKEYEAVVANTAANKKQ